MAATYDAIGRTYAARRRPDPRIAATIGTALAGSTSILNVGAGSGSYEPPCGAVIAVEPSRTMIEQRSVSAAPVVQARAEALPFADRSFDAVLGVLTIHHWRNQGAGLAECARVARSRVVLLTVDFEVCSRFWLFDYLPALYEADRYTFPRIGLIAEALGPTEITPVMIPADCLDGFLCAYWKRPNEYLDPLARASISTFSKVGDIRSGLEQLRADVNSGAWHERYRTLQGLDELDLGYRIVTAHVA
jgi:SAM-dependent methyltransferase